MIILRTILFFATLSIAWLQAPLVQSATYYISPNGSDSNPGTSENPWLTFAHALNSARAWCGDTLVLLNGTYGDGTRTGKIDLGGAKCAQGNEMIITAQNQRKAKIVDNGLNVAVHIQNSAYLILDGIYGKGNDNNNTTNLGMPFRVYRSHHITLRNLVAHNVNRHANAPMYSVFEAQDILLEDNEAYVYHRHCVTGWRSERVTVRRQYCNPRGGRIEGGIGVGPRGKADGLFSMYPCKDCILENSIQDGTTHGAFLSELNASFGGGVLMKGARILGSICYKCQTGNGIYPNGRKVADVNHTPHNLIIRDVVFIDFNSPSAMIRCQDCMNATIDHITGNSVYILGMGQGIMADDTAAGTGPMQNSVTITNSVITGTPQNGFRVVGYNTWSGDRLYSYNNGTSFNPSSVNWTNTSTSNPQLGACKLWIPDSSPLKGAGSGGSDIGATILYRYVNGVLTKTPLWDPVTGAFPHGEADLDNTNRIAGESLFDIHKRLNVNTRDCPFPRDYGNSNSDTKEPVSPAGLRVS